PRGAGSANDPAAKVAIEVDDLVTAGERDRALDIVLKARRDNPQNAAFAFTAGRLYFSKLYWTDGIKNFRDAIRLDPTYRTDPDLIKTTLRGFITTPDVERPLEEFLREDIGAPAIPYLDETAKDHPNAAIRAR